MSFNEVTNINFELTEAKTWGLEKSKFGDGYSLPLILDEKTAAMVKSKVDEYDTKSPIYGASKKYPGTLYLKIKNLSDKQKAELLNKGRLNILVYFSLTGTYTNKNGKKYLVFKTQRLCKIANDAESEEVPQD